MSDNLPAPILPEFPPKAEFRKWLRSLPPDAVVAVNWRSCDCPVAIWMLKAGIADAPDITRSSWRPDNEAVTVELPTWAAAFVRGIDRWGAANKPPNCSRFGPVTAADCLAVLRRTPRE